MPKRSKFCTFLVLLTIVSLLSGGCVRRRMTVRSNPPGATVYLDGKEIGRTPFSTNFDFYGKREFRIVKEGYETKTELLPVRAPWYQWIGLDFISEVVLPGKLTDHKYYEFEMQPDAIVPRHELVGRAEDLRRMAHAEGTLRAVDGNGMVSTPQSGSIYSYQESLQPFSTPGTTASGATVSGATVYGQPITPPSSSMQPYSPNYTPPFTTPSNTQPYIPSYTPPADSQPSALPPMSSPQPILAPENYAPPRI